MALDMGDRYLKEESKGFCPFEDEPDVLVTILEKYSSLESNLDEFLFEFVRPYIEQRLSPFYREFTSSEEFERMKR